ncbi:MAG: hypothetical protein CL862_05590 [Cyanobium sp. NAT70]|nr:hypothetical protein [Cyanobium sp. NAT70]|tara:strand:- start:4531 stop:5745 length:1215 start_codon:yes stop_codon:yes gene_type:complete
MAIDSKGLIDYDLAYLFQNQLNRSDFNYFIDGKGNSIVEGKNKPIAMNRKEKKLIKNVMGRIGSVTALQPIQVSDINQASIVIQKTQDHSDYFAYMTPESWGTYIGFSEKDGKKDLHVDSRATIEYVIADALGLGRPFGRGTQPEYSSADTIMSSNLNFDSNGNEVYFGYTSSDLAALNYWWGNEVGDRSDQAGVDPEKSNFEQKKLNRGKGVDDRLTTIKVHKGVEFNVIPSEIAELDLKDHQGPVKLRLGKKSNVTDARSWNGRQEKGFSGITKMIIDGDDNDDIFYFSGKHLKATAGYDFLIYGGLGQDEINIDSVDGLTGTATLLFGSDESNQDTPRVVKISGSPQDAEVPFTSRSLKTIDVTPRLVIADSVETVVLGENQYTFDQFYSGLKAGSDLNDF